MSHSLVGTLTSIGALLGVLLHGAPVAAAQRASTVAAPGPAATLVAMSEAEQTRLALGTATAEITNRAAVHVLSHGRYIKAR
jgi:hypothetical protein